LVRPPQPDHVRPAVSALAGALALGFAGWAYASAGLEPAAPVHSQTHGRPAPGPARPRLRNAGPAPL